jgi:3-oxoacyl-[acyl-carrier-protein] synthase III
VFVSHQANARIIDAVATKLGLTEVVVARGIIGSGNTSAASIRSRSLAVWRRTHQSPDASLCWLVFGAGLSYAGQVVRLP